MAKILPFLFPILGNLLGVYLVLKHKRQAIPTMLAVNLAASFLFGVSIAVKVFCCTAEPSLWPMPLVFATFEYWSKFGIAIAIVTLALLAWSNRGTRELPS